MSNTGTKLVVVTDPGKDLDDENTLVLIRKLTDLRLVDLKAVVAVLAPSKKRAMLAKGTLNKLALDAPVGIGSNCTVEDTGQSDHEFEGIPYLADESELENGQELLLRTLEEAEDKSLVWLLIAGQTDPATVIRDHAALFCAKTSHVAIMGGVKQEDNHVVLNADGLMEPDSAANNAFDMESAKFLYRRLQELRVPMTVLTREAAYSAQVPRNHYDHIAGTGNAIGVKLKNTQKQLIEALWKRANYPADDPRREKLPARCDRIWFCNTFCGGQGQDRSGEESIWDLVKGFNLYDPMACVSAVPSLSSQYFDPEVVEVNGVQHKIIGVSKTKTGIADGKGLVEFLTGSILAGLETAQQAV